MSIPGVYVRRRQVNQLRAQQMAADRELARAIAPSVVWAEPAAKPKGHCPKCGKHIGRGIHWHQKKCNGNPR